MDPLCYDSLSLEERIYIGSLSKHPGFIVLEKLMHDACNQMNSKVIKLKPEDADYDRKLKAFQLEAHVANDFCATLLKSIKMHTQAGELEEQYNKNQELAEQLSQVPEEVSPPGFGTVKIKPRKGE